MCTQPSFRCSMARATRVVHCGWWIAVVILIGITLSGDVFRQPDPVYAATFTVTTTADSGPGSLRQAILDANTTPDTDTITFNIPGTGPHTIQPLSALPEITDPVIIDGLTQPGADCSSWPPTLMIEGRTN